MIREGGRVRVGEVGEKENMGGGDNGDEDEVDVDGWTAEKELGITYRNFQECVVRLVGQVVRTGEEERSNMWAV
jgi:hypothetical protein